MHISLSIPCMFRNRQPEELHEPRACGLKMFILPSPNWETSKDPVYGFQVKQQDRRQICFFFMETKVLCYYGQVFFLSFRLIRICRFLINCQLWHILCKLTYTSIFIICMNYIQYIQYVHIYIFKYCPILSISSSFQGKTVCAQSTE